MTTTEPPSLTRENVCPACGVTSQLPQVWLWGKEHFAGYHIMCPDCYAEAARQEAEVKAAEAWERTLRARMPDRYHAANAEAIPADFYRALSWAGQPTGGLGLVGPPDAGKSSALACLIKRLRWPFLWWSGTEARQAAIDAATTGEDRKAARQRWEHGMSIPLLVLDDISQAKFTEAWASSLFDLLETRLSHNRATLWTSQITIGELRNKIAKQAGDDDQAAAIARRLGQHSLILTGGMISATR